MNQPLVEDITTVLERWYPPELAEDWDVVGLAVGSSKAAVTRVGLAVELSAAVVAEAVESGTDLLVVHHPLLLRGIASIDTESPKGAIIQAVLAHGIAVYVAHTNADVAPGGVVDALADVLGLVSRQPLRPAPTEALDKIVTFVPTGHVNELIDALASAGAGQIGAYDRCAFSAEGTGTFRPLTGARPFLGELGRIEVVAETRVEMVLRRTHRAEVLAALRAVHPYEAPAFDLLELVSTPSTEVGLGRVGHLAGPTSLGAFAAQVAAALPATAGGVRVAGHPDRVVASVAVQAGAGDDLLSEARGSGADVYVTSDLRHHPSGDALAWPGSPALVDIPHWAAEWTWLPALARRLGAELSTLETSVPIAVSSMSTDPWTFRVP